MAAYRLHYSDYPGAAEGPPDPERWVGPPGPPGQDGVDGQKGDTGPMGPPGSVDAGSVTGPLYITATGGTVSRSAQDRAADVANVLDWGADPTGVADATAAIQGAVATGRRVVIPRGHYKVTDAISIATGQIIEGDGRSATLLVIPSSFNMSAAGVFVLTAGTAEQGVEIRDLWIRFTQPDFAGMARTDIIQYPPAINAVASTRAKFINLLISNAWTGIMFDGGGAGFLDRLEMSAYHIGLNFGAVHPVLDVTHISNFHFWPFDLTGNQSPVMADGGTVSAQLGRIDGLVASDWLVIQSTMNITDTGGTGGYYSFSNIYFDGPLTQLNIVNPFMSQWTNIWFSKAPPAANPAILVSGGRASFHNLIMQSSMTAVAPIQVTGGIAMFQGGPSWWKEGAAAGVEFITVSGGACTLSDIDFRSHTIAHTKPFVHQSGAGTLTVKGCTFSGNMTGAAIQIDADNAGHGVFGNDFNAMTFAPPGGTSPLGFYGANNDPNHTLHAGSIYASADITAGSNTTAANLVVNGPAGSNRQFRVTTAGVPRWSLYGENTAEGGSDAGTDLILQAYHDNGAQATQPLRITRSSGKVLAPSLAASNFILSASATPISRQTVSGAKGSNVALASVIAALVAFGFIADSTTA